jgi:hypothetical protein
LMNPDISILMSSALSVNWTAWRLAHRQACTHFASRDGMSCIRSRVVTADGSASITVSYVIPSKWRMPLRNCWSDRASEKLFGIPPWLIGAFACCAIFPVENVGKVPRQHLNLFWLQNFVVRCHLQLFDLQI